jgi:hypothetical protein
VTDENIPFEPVYGPPAPSPRRRPWHFGRLPRAALAGGVALGLAVGGAGIAYAASSTGSSTTTPGSSTTTPPASKPTPPGGKGFRGFGPGGPGGPGGLGGLGRFGSVLHGQFTVPATGSGYQTLDVQVGTVTSVSTTSITVKSTDGFSQSYVVASSTLVDSQRDGIGSVAKQDQVEVVAKVSGGTATATSIVDQTKVKSSRSGFGFPFGGRTGGSPPAQGGGSGSSASTAGAVD